MSAPRFAARVTALIVRFRRDKAANIAVIFGIAIIPIMTALGCAVDYSLAARLRAKLQAAADAASVAAIAKNSPGFIAASSMTSDGTVAAAQTDAVKIFNGNASTITGSSEATVTVAAPTATVTKTGIMLNSTVQYSAVMQTTFLKAVGFPNITVSGNSSSTSSFPPYLDFYLMLDVSGSMGLPSTNAEQTRLSLVNPDDFTVYTGGCTFACHFQTNACSDPSVGQHANAAGVTSPVNSAYPTNNYCLGYAISRLSQTAYQNLLQTTSNYPMKNKQLPSAILANLSPSLTPGTPNSLITGNSRSVAASLTPATSCPTEGTDACIQLRADAVGYALTQLFITANASMKVTNQFRIGLYPFVQYLYSYFALTSSINGSPSTPGTINYAAANLATLLDTGNNSNLGSGGTHFENAFSSMNTLIASVGAGTSATNRQPYVFLVTDGAQNFQTQWSGGWGGSNSATVMPLASSGNSYCKPLKDRGIIISVLYIPYQPIQNPTTIFNNEDNVANANIPSIPPSLQDCASPGNFYTATTPADITTALNAMFNHVLVTAHITN
jgi:Flp pilus assembly protein TadG